MRSGIITTVRDHVLQITLDRPEKRNAVTLSMAREIADAMDTLDGDDRLRVGVLVGSGGVFSAGGDLSAARDGELPIVAGRGFGGLTRRPPRKPLIAAVEGYALGGAFEMVLACDLVVAASDARFALPEVRRGVVASGGGALLLAQRLPRAVALELLLTGEAFDAGRAERLGLVNRVVPRGEVLATALTLARDIAANAPLAVQASKQIANLRGAETADRLWQEQEELLAAVRGSADAAEGARAFVDGRAPSWTGP